MAKFEEAEYEETLVKAEETNEIESTEMTKANAKYISSGKAYHDYMIRCGFETGKFTQDFYMTHDGYPLSVKEAKFIDVLVETGNLRAALNEAQCGEAIMVGKDYIVDEIKYRLDQLKNKATADAAEVMQYFTRVMRGEIQDQFGLEASLGDRTAAAKELAKRLIDAPAQAEAKQKETTVSIRLIRD